MRWRRKRRAKPEVLLFGPFVTVYLGRNEDGSRASMTAYRETHLHAYLALGSLVERAQGFEVGTRAPMLAELKRVKAA